jgi:hypothetical protein
VLGELPTAAFVGCATAVLPRDTSQAVVEPLLTLTVRAAELWFPLVGAGAEALDGLEEAARQPDVRPVVARTVLERSDELRRTLAAPAARQRRSRWLVPNAGCSGASVGEGLAPDLCEHRSAER